MTADDQVRVRITTGGQITIPATLRYGLGLYPGDVIILTRQGDEVRMTIERKEKARERERLKVVQGGK